MPVFVFAAAYALLLFIALPCTRLLATLTDAPSSLFTIAAVLVALPCAASVMQHWVARTYKST